MYIIPKPSYISIGEKCLNLDGKAIDDFITELIDKDEENPERYTIKITEKNISVTAGGKVGLYRARTTINQLLFSYRNCLPAVLIKDEPRFSHRGFMVDSARHMQSIDELKSIIDIAALLKLNIFHWHLADDQGFRIELLKHPQITKKGSVRQSSEFNKNDISYEPYGGYYTKEQLKEIVNYCKERYIEVVPELDLPGHTTAILHARPDLSCTGKDIELKVRGGIFPDILCAGNPDTYLVIKDILDEICEIFPGELIHLGGDEAPKTRWENCSLCRDMLNKLQLDNTEQLQGHFVNTFSQYLKTKGKSVIVWNESIRGDNLLTDAAVQYWMDKTDFSVKWANSGNRLILSPFTPYYMDYPYGMHSLKAVYRYEPLHLKGLNEKGRESIIGVEAPVWTEHITNFSRLTYMCFPRLFALSETAWTSREKKSYKDFEKRAEFFCGILLERGINCAPKKDWNPVSLKRLSETAGFFKDMLSTELVKDFLNRNKEDKNEKA